MNRSLWKFLTSLRLTIVLLACAIVLVFVGTVAQADEGLYQVQHRYFRHWFLMGTTLWGHKMPWFIWPAGYTIGVSLLVNLTAAHIKRFQWSTSKLGIHLTHLGIIILLVGQLATDMLQIESQMIFKEGETDNFIERTRYPELAVITDAGKNEEQVVSIPSPLLAAAAEPKSEGNFFVRTAYSMIGRRAPRKGEDITHPNLPFTIRVKEYTPNSELVFHAKVLEAAGQLSTALATVEGEFATPEGLLPLAEGAADSAGRIHVWQDALQAVGEKDVQDIVAAAKRVAAQPERESKLRTELKTRFRNEMLQRFGSMPERGDDPDMARAMRYAAAKIGAGQTITPESLPTAAPNGAGAHVSVTPLPEVKDMDSRNFPYAVLQFEADGKDLGTWLVSDSLREQKIAVGDKTVRVALREQRTYLPYSIKLLHATHKVYAGSDIPKDFRSRILITNPTSKENRETEISMNDPLRYNGLAYYQYQMTKDELDRAPGLSVLQVVHNPSWLVPYIGCLVVASGLIWQFLHHLVGFITKRRPA